MTREEILKRAQEAFFAAMKVGWAAGTKTIPDPIYSGYKQIPTFFYPEDRRFKVVDRYCVGVKGSAGTTTVWYLDPKEETPVWFMSYGGFYPKEVIPFLKRTLMEAYRNDQFFCGRGPDSFEHKSFSKLLYSNNRINLGFERFRGFEQIVKKNEFPHKILGYHDYFGLALI